MSLIKGIKKGKTIELLEEIDIPDGEEILINIKKVNDFWSSLEEFKKSKLFKNIDFAEEDFTDLRDRSTGRNINL